MACDGNRRFVVPIALEDVRIFQEAFTVDDHGQYHDAGIAAFFFAATKFGYFAPCHPAFTQVQRGEAPGHSIRTEEWRYTEWGFGKMGEELYYEKADPQELHNLAANSKYTDVVKQMKALFNKVRPNPVTGGKAFADAKERYSN